MALTPHELTQLFLVQHTKQHGRHTWIRTHGDIHLCSVVWILCYTLRSQPVSDVMVLLWTQWTCNDHNTSALVIHTYVYNTLVRALNTSINSTAPLTHSHTHTHLACKFHQWTLNIWKYFACIGSRASQSYSVIHTHTHTRTHTHTQYKMSKIHVCAYSCMCECVPVVLPVSSSHSHLEHEHL